jgi:hypothetical protein
MTRIATILLLSLLLRASPPQSAGTGQTPAAQKPRQSQIPTPAGKPAETTQQNQPPEVVLSDEVATIVVLPSCADLLDELTARRRLCPLRVVYELKRNLSEGHLEVFNLLHVEGQYPLPDLSAGTHTLDITEKEYFYWPENKQTVPDPMLFFSVGTSATTIAVKQLWEKTTYSGESVYDYKPPPPPKEIGDPTDLAAPFRGDDLGFAEFNTPYKHNMELRDSGHLPEVEILGVGFVEGTPVECGKGANPDRFFTSPLRDVRVVSTVAHDGDDAIPVLKAAKFTVPSGVFTYRSHVRIVGKLRP